MAFSKSHCIFVINFSEKNKKIYLILCHINLTSWINDVTHNCNVLSQLYPWFVREKKITAIKRESLILFLLMSKESSSFWLDNQRIIV